MKMTFQDAEAQDALGATTPNPTTETPDMAPALRDDKAVTAAAAPYAPPASYVTDEDGEGEFTRRDMQYPSINIVQKSGDLSDEFDFGDIVLAKELVLGTADKPITVIPLQIQKQYQEVLPFGTKQRPRLFDTAAEAGQAGFSTEWEAKNRVSEILRVVFWVPQPVDGEGDHLFVFDGPKGRGAVVKFTAARTAYGTIGKALIQAKRTFCSPEKGGLVSMEWQLYSTLEKRESNSWHLGRLKPMGPTDPELAAYLRTLKASA